MKLKQMFAGAILAAIATVGLNAAPVHAATYSNSYNVYITEWMYKPSTTSAGEFSEITNVGSTSVDLTGWSYDDNHEIAGTAPLSGTLGAGQSLIITDDTAADFLTAWSLPNTVLVENENPSASDSLGNGDEINIYDASGALVDRLTYANSGNPITSGFSANIPFADLGADDAADAVASSVGDAYGSIESTGNDIGNPGSYAPVATPEPASLSLLALGGLALLASRRRAK